MYWPIKIDRSLIPPGDYCYWVILIGKDEILANEWERFGRELREFHYCGAYKEVLCPYWNRTGYGTVRYEVLGEEYIDNESPNSVEKNMAHFGSEDAPKQFPHSWALPDEIKICGIREDERGEWLDEIPADLRQFYSQRSLVE